MILTLRAGRAARHAPAYAGLRIPQEVLALEWSHVRERTLLVDQRNIDGQIIPGQKVRHFRGRVVDLVGPLRQDQAAFRSRVVMAAPGVGTTSRTGTDASGARRARTAGIEVMPAYDLRDAFASLQIRAGLSIQSLRNSSGTHRT